MSQNTKLIHEEATPQAVRAFTLWIFGIWLLTIITDPLDRLSTLPVSIVHPTGVLFAFLPESLTFWLLTSTALNGLKVLLLMSILCVLLNRFMPVSSVLSCFLLTVHQSLVRSFGEMNHTEINLLYAAYVLTVFYLLEPRLKRQDKDLSHGGVNLYSIPLIIILAIFCYTYTLIGIHRFVYGGVEVFTSSTLRYWIIYASNMARFFSFHMDWLVIEFPWLDQLLKMGYPISSLLEVLAPFCLVSRRFRIVFLFCMIPFHFLIWFFMGVVFLEQLALYVLFFEFSRWPLIGRIPLR